LKTSTIETPVLVIDLYPRLVECTLCGALARQAYGVPMFEGEVVSADHQGDWAGFDACEACFRSWRADQDGGDAP